MSGGPKNYAFETEKGQSVQKVKGITLNYRASQVVTLEALEKMIHQEIEVTVFWLLVFCHQKKLQIQIAINVRYEKDIWETQQ